MVTSIEAPRAVERREYEIGEIVVDNVDIVRRIVDLARQIARDYEGKEVMLVGIMEGASDTMTYLMQALHKERLYRIDKASIAIGSYGSKTTSDEKPVITQDLIKNPTGKHVIVVDDVVDSGKTLHFAEGWIRDKGAQSVTTLALVDKRGRRQVHYSPTYIGFIVNDPNLWLQGFGMDSMGIGRGDPHIRRGPYDYRGTPSST